jgi:hypothetical protein
MATTTPCSSPTPTTTQAEYACLIPAIRSIDHLVSETQNGAQAVVDGIAKRAGQLACALREPRAVDQLQAERHRNGILRQTRHRSREQHIASEARPIKIRRERYDVGLPNLDTENVIRRHNNTRPTLVELHPVHPASCHHGADCSIRTPAARASWSVGGSVADSAASASSC